jgi:hypothetical protein
MLAVAYQDGQTVTTEAELFDSYIAKRLDLGLRKQDRRRARKKEIEVKWAYAQIEDEPETEITKRYLIWLARQLKKNNIPNNFWIEQMQPSWLETTAQKWQYRLIVGLVIGLMGGLMSSLVFVFIAALIISKSVPGIMTAPPALHVVGLILGVHVGLRIGLISGLIFGLVAGLENNINPTETLKISFSNFTRKRFKDSLMGGLMDGLMGGLIFAFSLHFLSLIDLQPALQLGLISGLQFGLINGVISGLKEPFITREVPNQGIIASAKNTLLISLLSYLAVVILFFLFLSLIEFNWQSSLLMGLVLGIPSALLAGPMSGGGLAVLQHVILRFLLHRQGHIPHNYAQFLRYTTERRLTQQIGGRFRFIHRELLDHFADMEEGRQRSSAGR